ncbi:EF-P beta-lysylation protein EpmB [Allorhodopirellula solitaria]|uniref:L-lysine 2,3-aminomutase n=1 Tax=Allorhodopirellula solitaria TaxID=2527987 RepID=A0A5C5YK61_9BACT|nr:EF-P beta-lysylation protein EpmB [Allorhodopirellula solitaria]TWT75208.1 L-lysine 2,3-aminomutase [Allorhodopirellula solitaria]
MIVNRTAQSLTSEGRVVPPQSSKDFAASRQAGQISPPPGPAGDDRWLDSMRRAIRSAAELRHVLGLESPGPENGASGENPSGREVDYDFPVFVPREFAARMQPGDDSDPLLLQVMPSSAEGVEVAGFDADPVGDREANVAPGVLHKYAARALIITTGACGVHCRYCFRRAFPYHEAGSRSQAYAPSLDYLRQRDDIDEVIFSGGDPLTMTDSTLETLIGEIEAIEHVKRLRIHSRMPIVIPSRVNSFLVERLRHSRLSAWMVVHSNHAAEIDAETSSALQRMVDAGIPVLNQSVLLRGINDSVAALEALSRSLIDCRVIPYYLHQLDRVAGAAHFEVPQERGLELIAQLESRLPGFAVPRYVREIAGEKSKTRL